MGRAVVMPAVTTLRAAWFERKPDHQAKVSCRFCEFDQAALSERVWVFRQRMTAETIVPSTAMRMNPITTIRN